MLGHVVLRQSVVTSSTHTGAAKAFSGMLGWAWSSSKLAGSIRFINTAQSHDKER